MFMNAEKAWNLNVASRCRISNEDGLNKRGSSAHAHAHAHTVPKSTGGRAHAQPHAAKSAAPRCHPRPRRELNASSPTIAAGSAIKTASNLSFRGVQCQAALAHERAKRCTTGASMGKKRRQPRSTGSGRGASAMEARGEAPARGRSAWGKGTSRANPTPRLRPGAPWMRSRPRGRFPSSAPSCPP